MLMEDLIVKIKNRSGEIAALLGFESEAIVTQSDGVIHVNIQTVDSPAILIGRGGEGIEALQHILRIFFGRELFEQSFNIVLDVAGYRDKKSENIKREARDKALQVLSTGIEEVLPPMPSFDRRVVHMVCSNIADVETESLGEGRERRVVIRPKKQNK
jgi:predicted RNA-binding protein Jag